MDERSVGTDQANKFVLTLTSSNTVQYQAVELGPLVNGKRIVRSGVTLGEKIVVNGMSHVPPWNVRDARSRSREASRW
ncbi:MAG: hypothetical protein WDN00_11600 [Limisphaerales bacterium]